MKFKIFAFCCVIFLLVCCRSSKPTIVEYRENVKLDTIKTVDTLHATMNEKIFVREIIYKDTALGHDVKETTIIRDVVNNASGQSQQVSSSKSNTTTSRPNKQAKKKKSFELYIFCILISVLILVFLLLYKKSRPS